MDPLSKGSNLGSLAQTARAKHLNQARWLLIIIGVLTIAVNGFQVAMARSLAQTELQNEVKKQGLVIVDHAKYKEVEDKLVQMMYLLGGGLIAVGALFVIFGLIVKAFPVPITVTSLVIYIAAIAVFAVLDPASLAQGIIVKIIIIVALAKAVQAAIAYQKEEQSAEQATVEGAPQL